MDKSHNLLDNLIRINNWIEDNLDTVGNANMFEIMHCMLERNDIKLSEEENDINKIIDDEINKMINLRYESIKDFFKYVPECKDLYEKVCKGSVTATSDEEMDFICKCESVPFYIYNIRVRNDGDIRIGQIMGMRPDFQHDNESEINTMVESYNKASDKLKGLTYPALNWVIDNSILKGEISIEETIIEEPTVGKKIKKEF